MPYSKVLVASDNEVILQALIALLTEQPNLTQDRSFRFACHPSNQQLTARQIQGYTIEPVDLKRDFQKVIDEHDLIISAHCKQIFPAPLVVERNCINIHPGYNPHNRGWYPQVFSILNGLPLGATIHEIDEQLDHGKIIVREKVILKASDTSLTAYLRVQDLELQLLRRTLPSILEGTYKTFEPEEEGNMNLKRDYEALRELPLDERVTFQQAIDRLRALTHPPFKNAYFIDKSTGKKIWISVELHEDDEYEE